MKIREYEFELFGHLTSIRIEPFAFKQELKRLERIIEDGDREVADLAIEESARRWGWDAELVRLSTFNNFANGEHENDS